jgi:hypothetical protein
VDNERWMMVGMLSMLLVAMLFSGCTQNYRAKELGGTATEVLEKGRKLVNVTWKDDNLWILTRPMATEDTVETYTFKESSSFGMFQGTVVIKESR